MATTIYFVKATYDDNIYKLSDFYTGTSYKQIANKSMNVDMAFNDGPTTLDTHIRILPDATDIRDHTHIIVPSKKKIYRIDSIDEPNYDAYRLYLTDDPLISNYQTFKSQNMYLTRTNEQSFYTGLNDLPSLGTVPTSSSVKNIGGEGAISGDWLLVFVQSLDKSQQANHQKSRVTLNIGDAWRPFISEEFSSMEDVYTRYPILGPYNTKEALNAALPFYYGLIIKVTQSEDSYYCYSASYNETESKYYMTWDLINPKYYRPIQFGWNNLTDFQYYGTYNEMLATQGMNILGKKWFIYAPGSKGTLYQYKYDEKGYGWHKINGYGNITGHGNSTYKPSSPANGYRYANTELMQIQEYYVNNPFSGEASNIILDDIPMKNVVNVFPNQPVMIFALPLQTTDSSSGNDKNLLSALAFKGLEWYNGTAWQSYNILSARIINGSSVIKNVLVEENPGGDINTSITSYTTKYPDTNVSPWSVGFITNQVMYANISYQSSAITNYTLREPFKYYELWVYGQKYEIPSYLVHRLYIRQSINSNGLNYMIYKDPDFKDLYISGVVSMEVQWNNDSLAEWVAQNPTYKDQFNLRKQQQWAETLSNAAFSTATGAVSGSVIPVIGTAAGAAMGAIKGIQGIATTAIRTSFDKKNLELGLQSNRLLTDKLYGDTSSALQYWNIRHGIYWVVKTMNNETQMKLTYDTTGYPTNVMTSINGLPYTTSTTLGVGSKLVYGYFNHTIVNAYVTQAINNKMKDGIILVE